LQVEPTVHIGLGNTCKSGQTS